MSELITNSQIFYINSNTRIEGDESDFTYKINLDPTLTYDRVAVLECSIPKSYYLIQHLQNTFILKEGEIETIITIPEGNYSRTAFKLVLKTLLNNNSPNSFIYNITDDNALLGPETGKFTFTVQNNDNIQPQFIFQHFIYEQMGFNFLSINTFVDNQLKSVNVINFSKESTLFLHSDICQNNSNNILQDIFTTGDPTYSFIEFQNPNPYWYSKSFGGKADIYRFYLTDENDNKIYLNGINMNITIIIYQTNKIYQLIEKFINLKSLED